MREHTLARDIEGRVGWRGDPDYGDIRASMLWDELKPDRFPDGTPGRGCRS